MARAGPGRRGARGRAQRLRGLPHRAARHPPVAPGGVRMSDLMPYQYVVLRCVPRIERGELMNVGVVLHCQAADYLALRWHCDPERLRALDPALDPSSVCDGLGFIERVCAGEASVGV